MCYICEDLKNVTTLEGRNKILVDTLHYVRDACMCNQIFSIKKGKTSKDMCDMINNVLAKCEE